MNHNGEELLIECIEAEYQFRLLVQEYEEEEEVLYAAHYPGYERDLFVGTLQTESLRIDQVAIALIELEQKMKNRLSGIKEYKRLYNKAMSILTDREKVYFNHLVWDESLDHELNDNELNDISEEINKKLCNYLEYEVIKWNRKELT